MGAHEAPKSNVRKGRENIENLEWGLPPEEEKEETAAVSQPEPRRGRPGWFVGLISALCVIAVLALACAGFVFYTASLDTIYPNVLLDGVYVGGITPEAAALLLQSQGEEGFDGKSVTVELPMGESLTVTAEQLGLGGDPAAAAREAFAYGRDGGYIQNAVNYIKCFWGQGVNILWKGSGVDTQALQQIVTAAAEPLNRRLESAGAEITEQSVTFTKGAGAMELDVQELSDLIGMAFAQENYEDMEYIPEIEGEANVELESLYSEIYRAPENAGYDKATGAVTEHVPGLDFDMEAARALLEETRNGEEVVIPLTVIEPAISTDMMEEYLFRDLLSEKGTYYGTGTSGRNTNIQLASNAIDGTVLLPGEEFDYNLCLGERTAAKGYQEAGVYTNGQHSTGIGGGICQVSSTLYYCAMYADLDITERVDHYFTVGYLPIGLDATVSWGGPNLRFVNQTDYPVKIESWTSNGNIYVQIWGTNLDGRYVEVKTDGWEDADYYYAVSYRSTYAADGTVLRESEAEYSQYHKYEATEE